MLKPHKKSEKYNFLSKVIQHSHQNTVKHTASKQQKMLSLTDIKSFLLLLIYYLQDSGIWIASTRVSLDLTEFCAFP